MICDLFMQELLVIFYLLQSRKYCTIFDLCLLVSEEWKVVVIYYYKGYHVRGGVLTNYGALYEIPKVAYTFLVPFNWRVSCSVLLGYIIYISLFNNNNNNNNNK